MAHDAPVPTSRFASRFVMRTAITFATAAALLTAGLAFVGVEQAGASPTLAFTSPPAGNYGTVYPPVLILGTSYSYNGIEATGNVGTVTYTLNSALPQGLSLDPTTGAVTGTDTLDPSGTPVYTFVTISDSSSPTANAFFIFQPDSGLSAMPTAAPTTIDPGQASYSWNGDTTTGGVGTITYSDTNAALPAGLSFDTSTGIVSGPPSLSATPATITVTATDADGATASQAYTFGVDPALGFTSTAAPTSIDPGESNYSWNGDVATGGVGTISYSDNAATLPAGLSFDPTTGIFSGSPAANATGGTITVTATDADGVALSQPYTFTVGTALSFVSSADPTFIDPGQANYSWNGDTATGGVGPITYSAPGNFPGGLSFNTTTGAVTGSPSASDTDTQVNIFAADSHGAVIEHTYNFIVGVPLAFISTTDPTTMDPGQANYSWNGDTADGGVGTITYSAPGNFPAGLTFDATTGAVTGSPSANVADTQVDVFATDSLGAVIEHTYNFIAGVPLAFVSTTDPTTMDPGQANYSWNGDTATGGSGPITYSAPGNFPAGLTFNPTTGAVTGTPATNVADTQVDVFATDSLGAVIDHTYNFIAGVPLAFVSSADPTFIDPGQSNYSWNGDTATGGSGTITYSAPGNFPAGLTFNPTTGAVTGTPATNVADTQVDVFATDSLGAVIEHTYNFIVGVPLAFVSSADPTFIDPGQSNYSWNGDTATGGSGTITYSAPGNFPAGLTFNPTTGAVTGTPATNVADTQVDVFATDSLGAVIEHTYNFIVGVPLAFVSTTDPTVIDPGQANYSWNGDTATGGVGTINYSAPGNFPAGLSFNTTTGAVTGSPSASDTDSQVNVFATDSLGAVIEHTYNFIVSAPLAIGTGTPPTLNDGVGTYSFSGAEANGGSGADTYSLTGTLPSGLTLDTTTGLISQLGTATTTASATSENFSVTATDGLGASSTGQFTITATPVVVSGGGGGSSSTPVPVVTSTTIPTPIAAAIVPVNPRAFKVIGKVVVHKTSVVSITGIGFSGQPAVTSNEKGTKAVVSHDTGSLLTVHVTLAANESIGEHTFTIVLANGKSCKVNYSVVA